LSFLGATNCNPTPQKFLPMVTNPLLPIIKFLGAVANFYMLQSFLGVARFNFPPFDTQWSTIHNLPFPCSDRFVLLRVNNICAKFQGQTIYTKKDIRILPTCVIVRDNFTTTNIDTFPKIDKKHFGHEIFVKRHLYINNMCAKFQIQRFVDKKIFEIYQSV